MTNVRMPDGVTVSFPDDMPREQIKQLIASKFPEVEGGSIKGDLLARIKTGQEIKSDVNSGKTSKLGGAVDFLGKVGFGTINDVVGRGVGAVYEGVTSDRFKEANKETMKNFVAPAIAPIADAYGKFSKENPLAARRVESLANIATGVIGGGAATKVVKESPKTAVKLGASLLSPKIDKSTAILGNRMQELGVDIGAANIAPTRVRQLTQKIGQNIPFSGNEAFEALQNKQWHRAVSRTIGMDSDNLSPETIQMFLQKSKSDFATGIGNGIFEIKPNDIKLLEEKILSLPSTVTKDRGDVIRGNIQKVIDDLSKNTTTRTVPAGIDNFGRPLTKRITSEAPSTISAEKLSSLRSSLIENMGSSTGEIKQHIGDLVSIVHDIAARNASPSQRQLLNTARDQWKSFKVLEPLLEKSTDGFINPTELLNRVASNKFIHAGRTPTGENALIDLARGGKQFLKKREGSDTASKTLLTTFASSIPVAVLAGNPVLAAKLLAAGSALTAGNRAIQATNRSKTIADFAIKNALFKESLKKHDLLKGKKQ